MAREIGTPYSVAVIDGAILMLLSRRAIVLSLLQLGGFLSSPAGSQHAERAQVRMRLDDSALREIPPSTRGQADLQRDDSIEAVQLRNAAPPERAVPVFYIIVGALAIPVIWQSIMEMIRQSHFGGVLIDARQSPPLISSSLTIPANFVIFIAPSGEVQRFRSQDFNEGLLNKLLRP